MTETRMIDRLAVKTVAFVLAVLLAVAAPSCSATITDNRLLPAHKAPFTLTAHIRRSAIG